MLLPTPHGAISHLEIFSTYIPDLVRSFIVALLLYQIISMSYLKAKLPLFAHLMPTFALFLILLPGASLARHLFNQDCGSTFCGNLNISYPFRLKNQPPQCGCYDLELACENNNRTTLVLREGKFFVQNIFYENKTIQVMDSNLDKNDCNSLPLSSIYFKYLDGQLYSIFSSPHYYSHSHHYYTSYYYYSRESEASIMYVVNCWKPIKSSQYIDASRCITKSNISFPPTFFYFLDRNTVRNLNQACTLEAEVPIMVKSISGMSTLAIYNKLSQGFYLSWYENPYLELSGLRYVMFCFGLCLNEIGVSIILRLFFGIPCLLVLVIYKWRRRHLSMDDKIEEFLQSHNLAPIRYSFKEVKKMTKNFKDKLGEGGYGSVFKGKLRSGHHVAIKLLCTSKGKGQDFINEVASIGRIHHANVTKLIGFCVEGSKQALVYDFMSNGSLDKIIFSEEKRNTLGWKKLFDIVLGVAQGIDYLHQGCDMQILHFDIKPHNILLDENFNPKVSDFGLAKLYSVDDNIVSLTAARGTIGYIAPELVYKNLGGISYKADVYSFGMLVLEMVGRRKNLNAFANHTSQIYFPSWIYDRLDQGEDMELGDISDDEKVMIRKMIITAFWCIQLLPSDRPSMNKVLKMLESNVELFEMPPKPFHQVPLETSTEVDNCENSNDEESRSLDVVTITSFNVV
ncbi:LEAF RUST 10 DISEASE-RESISTANCE LOCUS RECEPTOR-LIKE PROTEIN KINASE-like 2.2 [Gossypium raimondii]|uniref:LEAF RUST 10 DISEASE-RESISTANCE LOCUS RECEPTOR-LIKE PROTEIN KINASE-like 2.2 n=1 Tax=Gossypium raimondii TaxID=29730 RepID=UPI00227A7790|nr:LEAF RUST 10 DISEASE-RESISTANCE LOCUS RECEPTOR-LIKE PROTEIN KINASE-like 2.2 [Gossypium raimondii]